MKKILAFNFISKGSLNNHLDILKNKCGKDLSFFVNGEYAINKMNSHPHQWWASPKDIDELNSLMNPQLYILNIAIQNKIQLEEIRGFLKEEKQGPIHILHNKSFIILQYHGWDIQLHDDGKYIWTDTTGG